MGSARDVFEGDRDRLDLYRRGDRAALEQIYWAYVDPVERVVTRRMRGEGPARSGSSVSVEDVVQEVFTRAFSRRARTEFDGLREFGPYLFTIARNVVADVFRRLEREVPTDLEMLDDRVMADDPRSPEASLSTDTHLLARVRDYLARLPADLAAAHYQRYDLGVSQDAAALAMGITRQRLRTLERRLRHGVIRELHARQTKDSSDAELSRGTVTDPGSPRVGSWTG